MMERRSRIPSALGVAVAILAMAIGLMALAAPADATTTPPNRAEVRSAAIASDRPQSQVAAALDRQREHSVSAAYAYDPRTLVARASAAVWFCETGC